MSYKSIVIATGSKLPLLLPSGELSMDERFAEVRAANSAIASAKTVVPGRRGHCRNRSRRRPAHQVPRRAHRHPQPQGWHPRRHRCLPEDRRPHPKAPQGGEHRGPQGHHRRRRPQGTNSRARHSVAHGRHLPQLRRLPAVLHAGSQHRLPRRQWRPRRRQPHRRQRVPSEQVTPRDVRRQHHRPTPRGHP